MDVIRVQIVPKSIVKKILAFIALLFGFNSTSIVAEDVFEFQHKNWATATIKVDETTSVFRALTIDVDENGLTIFIMDRGSWDCAGLYLQILRSSFSSQQSQSIPQGIQFGKSRIDEMPIRNINYEFEFDDGNDIRIKILNVEHENAFYNEIRNGKRIRFQFTGVDGEQIYISFSLAGSAAAMLKTLDLCDKRTLDEDYFDKQEDPIWSVNPNDDSSFF